MLNTIDGIELHYAEDTTAMFAALSAGEVDALACDSAVVLDLMKQHPELQITISLTERQHIAFALPKGSVWKTSLDAFLGEARANGTVRAFLQRYFGEEGAKPILEDGGDEE